MRASLLARLRRLERPRGSNGALRRELERLERLHPPVKPDFDSMTNEQLDDYLLLHSFGSGKGPIARMHELRQLLRSPEEVAEDERRGAMFDAMSDEELDAWLAGRCRTSG